MLDTAPAGSLFDRLKAKIQTDESEQNDWLEESRESFAYAAADQWTEEERRVLEEAQRSPITFDRIGSALNFIAGEEMKNRREVKFYPRSEDDKGANEVLSAAAEYYRDEAMAEQAESAAFQDALTCGVGFVEDRVCFDTDPDGEIKIEHIDPFEMGWDFTSHKPNMLDARHMWRAKKMARSEAEDLYPDFESNQLSASWFRREDYDLPWGNKVSAHEDDYAHDETHALSAQSDLVTIIELQYRELEPHYRLVAPNGQGFIDLPEDRYNELQELLGRDLPAQRWRKSVYYQAFLGAALLEHRQSHNQKGFTWKALTGYRDRQKGCWYGVVRTLKGPQKYFNVTLTTNLHIMNANAKGGLLYQEDAVNKPQEFEQLYSAADTAIPVQKLVGPNGQPLFMPKPRTEAPREINMIFGAADAAFEQVTGMNAEARGEVHKVQSPELAAQRRQSAMTVLQRLFDALRTYRLMQGKTLLYAIQTYLSDGRLIRIKGGGAAKYMRLIRQNQDITYDVQIDDSPSSPNMKERTWGAVTDLMKVTGPPEPDLLGEVLPYSPLPADMVEKYQKYLAAKKPSPQTQRVKAQAAQMQMAISFREAQLKLQKAEAEIARLQAQTAREYIEAADTNVNSQATASKAQSEAIENIAEAQLDAAQAAAVRAETAQGGEASERSERPPLEMAAARPDPAMEMMAMVANTLREVAEMSARPKRFVYDEAGNIIGAEVVN